MIQNPVSREEAEELRPLCEAPPPTAHLLHMPETADFTTPRGYDYLRADPRQNPVRYALERVLWNVVSVLLLLIDTAAFGLRIEGWENLKPLRRRGFVSVSNHVHPMDCTAAALALVWKRMYFVTLESNFRIPGIRHLIRALGGVPLPKSPLCTTEMLASMRTAVAQGWVVHMYPEAVLQPYADGLRPFHKGAFTLAASAGVPVLPMAITFRRPRGLYALYKRRPCMTLHLLPPVFPDEALSGAASARDMRLRAFCEMYRAAEG